MYLLFTGIHITFVYIQAYKYDAQTVTQTQANACTYAHESEAEAETSGGKWRSSWESSTSLQFLSHMQAELQATENKASGFWFSPGRFSLQSDVDWTSCWGEIIWIIFVFRPWKNSWCHIAVFAVLDSNLLCCMKITFAPWTILR